MIRDKFLNAIQRRTNRDEKGQALVLVILLLTVLLLMGIGLMTATINLNDTNQGDVYVHASQSASQAGLSDFKSIVTDVQSVLQKCSTTCPFLPPNLVTCAFSGSVVCPNAGNFLEKYSVTLSFPNCTVEATGKPCASVSDCQTAGGLPPNGNGLGCTIQVNSTGCVVPMGASSSTACLPNTSETSSLTLVQPVSSFLQFAAYTNYSADDPADALTYGTPNARGVYSESTAEYNAALKNCAMYMWATTNTYTGTPSPNATLGHSPTHPYGPSYGTWTDPTNGSTVACLYTYEDYGTTYNGPVYSSDVIWDCGITFNGNAYTGDPINSGTYNSGISQWMSNQSFYGPGNPGGFVQNNFHIGKPYYTEYPGCSGGPTFTSNNHTNGIEPLGALLTPPKQLTNLATAAALGGCLYTGPTVIKLLPAGKMAVYSPDTTSIPGFYNQIIGSSGQSCGTPGASCLAAGTSGNPTCTVNVPETYTQSLNGVTYGDGAVYVQDVPTSEQSSVSFCPNVEGEIIAPQEQQTCKWRGDLLIQGGNGNSGTRSYFDAAATFGTDSNIVITGSLTYANAVNPSQGQFANLSNSADANQAKADSLGLAGTYFTLINLPGDPGYYGWTSDYSGQKPHPNITIDGAILASNHAFGIDNLVTNACYNNGNCGPGSDAPMEGSITINGSLDTNFTLNNCLVGVSGYCGSGGSGSNAFFTSWDTQFGNSQNFPPLFPQPVYGPTQYAEGS